MGKNNRKTIKIIFFLYVLIGIYATFPLIFRLRESLYGSPTDPLVWVWNFWWFKYAWAKGISDHMVSLLVYPFGREFISSSGLWDLCNKYLTIWWGELQTYNIQIIISFVFAGLAMYWLVYYFTKNRVAAFLSGMIFTLCPYHFARS